MTVTGVVSADRRYVRISPTPNFTGVGAVTTFNIQSAAATGTDGAVTGAGGWRRQPGQRPPGGGGAAIDPGDRVGAGVAIDRRSSHQARIDVQVERLRSARP